MNLPTWRPSDKEMGTEKYLRLMLRLGAFRHDKKLATIGIEWDAAMNLLLPDPQGIKWYATIARFVATSVCVNLSSTYSLIWLVGHRVATAFDAGDKKYFTPFGRSVSTCVVVPHPSGLNRWWNDPENVRHARARIHELMETRER